MASNYTEELLKSILEVQQQCNEGICKLTNEIKLLKENYKQLKTEILVSKTVRCLLTDQINNLEKHCWSNAQYSTGESLEVDGIPLLCYINDLEGRVCISVVIKPDDIEAFPGSLIIKKAIVKFSKHKL